jgi:molybdenum cofactor biosynthesis protein A
MLFDNHNRPIDYLRLAVTDRCNLRCFYCMPEEGIQYADRKDLLSYEEMLQIVRVFASLGIRKVRITGGEPFVRRDMMHLLRAMRDIPQLEKINLTTNGVLTLPWVAELKALGIHTVNLSLDTLDRQRFFQITRRDEFDSVMATFHALLEQQIPTKINAVVMAGKNTEDILPMVELTRNMPVSVRFIEEMPFNGEGSRYGSQLPWDHRQIVQHLQSHYPDLQKLQDPPHSTAYHYHIPGHIGNIGIIAAYSRTFCGTCNRIRITPQGVLKTCLYDAGVFNIRDLIRQGASDEQLAASLQEALQHRAKDGWEAERRRFDSPVHESMSTIGG